MRSWMPYAGFLAACMAMPCVLDGCGENSFSDCTSNGTCPADGGGDGEENILVEAAGGDGSGSVDAGTGDADSAGEVESDSGEEAMEPEAGPTCDSASSIVCSGQCVDPTQPAHCGSCANACPAPASGQGTATCTAPTTCGIACSAGYHACSGDCLPDSDPPSLASDPCVVNDTLGVFVAPAASGGSDSAAGTEAAPFATIGHALANLGGKARVYVCDGTFGEQVTITAGTAASLYGGLACPAADAGTPWTYVGGVATVNSPAAAYALSVTGVTSAITVADVAFVAPDATGTDASGNGNSSIAALVSGSMVNLVRVTLTAGAGANGSAGAGGASAPNYSRATAENGQPGTAPGGDGGNWSGAGGMELCLVSGESAGGAGGLPGTGALAGGSGASGSATPAATASGTRDGAGGGGGLDGCTSVSHSGADGAPAAGGIPATSYGTISSDGWAQVSGGNGQSGAPGQGGGGGGGSGVPQTGGDGAGAGGCGGSGGIGGSGGGASIALASVGSTITLSACTLTTGAGGTGGKGGDGQSGQGGGISGSDPELGACPGGFGGNGAGGSGGAGGAAGISIGIVYTSTEPTFDSMTAIHPGSAGQPGQPGTFGTGGTNALGTGTSGNAGAEGFSTAAASGATLQGG
ncbi:MAG: hypothetical protein ACLP1X_10755 [Polyangiaceae bacterium]